MLTGATATAIPAALPPMAGLGAPAILQPNTGLEISPVSQKDTTYTKIFVGGLPYHTTDKSLREHFEVYGEIEEAVVITDRQTGKSRGYGFVTMADRASAERATKDPNPAIDGRKANVNLAYLGAKPRGPASTTGFTTALSPTALRIYPHLAGAPYSIPSPASYLHYSPYLQPTHIPLLPGHHQLNPSAAAAYTALPDAAAYLSAYQGATPGDPYAAVAAAGNYAIPTYSYGTAAGLPHVAASVASAAAAGTIPLAAYTTAQPQMQEARLQ